MKRQTQTSLQADRWTDRKTNIWVDGLTDRQANCRQTDTVTDTDLLLGATESAEDLRPDGRRAVLHVQRL